ncbi:hypothetical protein F53441_11201 [Fusarium austroafricanum]|uniref:Uncharacterized protein n=1 Tax=Fusarium austroafricanum TaxID=2364996 RepID=A0A8H4P0K1_9HYPO|nr:hypothetical protein F53441_11201 [Fusarium austroafricanum]
MNAFLSSQWQNEGNVSIFRALDNRNANCMVFLYVPWISWPNHPLDDVNSPWREIQHKAHLGVQQWKADLRGKLSGELHRKHMTLTSVIQTNQQLRLTVDSLGEGEEHMKLFYGFAADEIAKLDCVKGLDLGKDVIKWVGRGSDAYPVVRKSKRTTDGY